MDYQLYTFEQLDKQTLYEILAHRQEVFVLGQRAIYRDLDGYDQQSLHLVARTDDGDLVAYVRLLPRQLCYDGYDANSFGRLSVRAHARSQGIGGELVRRACEILAEHTGSKHVRISAMAYLEDFYRSLGFVPASELFDKEGVAHITMDYGAD